MDTLGEPNQLLSRSVDARQILDLKVGVAMTRMQTNYFRSNFKNQLGKLTVSYGPCQTPTLFFCCHRYSLDIGDLL